MSNLDCKDDTLFANFQTNFWLSSKAKKDSKHCSFKNLKYSKELGIKTIL